MKARPDRAFGDAEIEQAPLPAEPIRVDTNLKLPAAKRTATLG